MADAKPTPPTSGPGGPRSRIRRLLFGAAAVALGLTLAMIVFEIALRVFDLAPSAGLGSVNEKDFARQRDQISPEDMAVIERYR